MSRDKSGKWLPGQSANPNGRPANAERVRQLLEPHSEVLVKKAVELALSGDTTALKICLDRVAPVQKNESSSFEIEGLNAACGLKEKAEMVLSQIGTGGISPEVGLKLLAAINSLTTILQYTDIETRIIALEEKVNSKKQF